MNVEHSEITNLLLTCMIHKDPVIEEKTQCSKYFDKKYFEQIDKILNLLDMVRIYDMLSNDRYPRYFIYLQSDYNPKKIPKSDKDIGLFLEMLTPGGEYYNYKNPRVIFQINEEVTAQNIFTEIISMDNITDEILYMHTLKRVEHFNNAFAKYLLPFNCYSNIIFDDGTRVRGIKLSEYDFNYIIKNRLEYKNDFYNMLYNSDIIYSLFDSIITIIQDSSNSNELDKKKFSSLFGKFYQMVNSDQPANLINMEINFIYNQIIQSSIISLKPKL